VTSYSIPNKLGIFMEWRRRMIFMDVGAHKGETLRLLGDCAFERIIAFEPAPSCWPELEQAAAEVGAEVVHAGLLDRVVSLPLLYAGSSAASVYPDKRFYPVYCVGGKTAMCDFLRASDWLRDNVPALRSVMLKLNCEGAEVAILEDLLTTGEIDKIQSIALDWDCEKVASLHGKSKELVKRLPVPVWTQNWSEDQKISGVVAKWRRETEVMG
jgi:FkbM family methyltransferase